MKKKLTALLLSFVFVFLAVPMGTQAQTTYKAAGYLQKYESLKFAKGTRQKKIRDAWKKMQYKDAKGKKQYGPADNVTGMCYEKKTVKVNNKKVTRTYYYIGAKRKLGVVGNYITLRSVNTKGDVTIHYFRIVDEVGKDVKNHDIEWIIKGKANKYGKIATKGRKFFK